MSSRGSSARSEADRLLHRYHELEPELEADGELTYRRGADRARSSGSRTRKAPSSTIRRPLPTRCRRGSRSRRCAASLEEARARGWRLAILSNTDPDYIAASKELIGVPFDETVVASEIGSYKPAHRHWEEFFDRTGADRAGHVHVAASLFHDIAPANELGLRSVWINRLGERAEPAKPDRELPDLDGLADVLDELVPA